ncbi:MAG TPA: hypothetical protein PKA98_12320, partial [Acidimicrobiales bacterium]|nr:hypothetical protein [Acidimicrobiales bacterium]
PIYINTPTPSPPNPPPAPPPSPFGIRFMWKYACSSLPPSPDGLVIENVNAVPNLLNPAVTDYGNFLPGAIYNGAKDSPFPCSQSFTPGVFLGARSEQGDFIEHTRQVISLRYDPIVAREVALWRNAALLRPPTPIGANEGPWLDATNLYLGSGQICHAVLWHDRALTDDQISSLHTRLTTSR